MKRSIFVAPLAALAVALLIVSVVAAQTGGNYDLSWSTIAGGGGSSSGGSYALDGTIGQADAGSMSGGSFTLDSGFWSGVGARFAVFLPVILRP